MYMRSILISLLIAGSALGQDNQININAFYNDGQRHQTSGNHKEALKSFLKVIELDSTDWIARGKVIQEYQALGMYEQRNAQRDTLYFHRKSRSIESLNDVDLYCRDQFYVDSNKIMVFEYFELRGEQAVRYSFNVLDGSGKDLIYKLSLGSYEFTTQIAREHGEINKDQRLFHLDAYSLEGEHKTYGFFVDEPDYDSVKVIVLEVIRGKRGQISSTKPTDEGSEIKIE